MSNKINRIIDIIDLLHQKTIDNELIWRPVGTSIFEVRLGEYSFIIRSTIMSADLKINQIIINKLDGKKVISLSSGNSGLVSQVLSDVQIPSETKNQINEIFDHISDDSTDLDMILKLLK